MRIINNSPLTGAPYKLTLTVLGAGSAWENYFRDTCSHLHRRGTTLKTKTVESGDLRVVLSSSYTLSIIWPHVSVTEAKTTATVHVKPHLPFLLRDRPRHSINSAGKVGLARQIPPQNCSHEVQRQDDKEADTADSNLQRWQTFNCFSWAVCIYGHYPGCFTSPISCFNFVDCVTEVNVHCVILWYKLKCSLNWKSNRWMDFISRCSSLDRKSKNLPQMFLRFGWVRGTMAISWHFWLISSAALSGANKQLFVISVISNLKNMWNVCVCAFFIAVVSENIWHWMKK